VQVTGPGLRERLASWADAALHRPRSFTAALAAVVLLVGVGPDLADWTSGFIGAAHVDQYGTQWFYWFTERAVLDGHSLAHTDLFFYPYGKDIYRHTGANVLDAILAVPFRLSLGRELGYNVFCLVFVGLAGWAFHALARELSDDPIAVGVGAVCFAVSPYMLYELREGRPTQGLLVLLPLILLQARRTGWRPGLRAPLLGGVLLAVSGFQYWFYALFGGLALLVYGLVLSWRPPAGAGPGWRVFARFAVFGGVAMAVCAPVALPLILETAGQDATVPGLLDLDAWSLTSFVPQTEQGATVGVFTWQPLRGATGAFSLDESNIVTFSPFHRVLPFVGLVAVLAFLWRPHGRFTRLEWLALAVPLVICATGPVWVIGDRYLVDPIWGALLHGLAFLRRLWWPSRAFAWLSILVALALVAVLAQLGQRGPRMRRWSIGLTVVLWMGHLGTQKLLPLGTWESRIPAGYQCLAQGGDEAILELPWAWTQAHLYYQVHHGRPIFGGMLENSEVFRPPETSAIRIENTFVAAMMALAEEEAEVEGWTMADMQAMRELGYGFMVLQKDAYVIEGIASAGLVDNARRTRLRRMRLDLAQVVGSPVYEDARVAIYSPWDLPLPCADVTPDPDRQEGAGVKVMTVGDRAPDIPDREEVLPLLGEQTKKAQAPDADEL